MLDTIYLDNSVVKQLASIEINHVFLEIADIDNTSDQVRDVLIEIGLKDLAEKHEDEIAKREDLIGLKMYWRGMMAEENKRQKL